MFRCRSGADSPIEGKQKAFVPPPAGRAGRVPRERFRGKYRIPPAGFASRGRVASPRRETRRPPLGASGALPPRFARLRGRGLPRFCRLHHVGPLRPGSRNCPFPGSARVPRNHFPRCNPRALLEIRDNRLPLHKHSVSTSPLPLLSAFPQNLTIPRNERTLPPLPQKAGAEGWGIPLGRVLPPRRANLFRLLFVSLRKVAPAERKNKQFLLVKNHKQNFKVCPANQKQTIFADKP